MRGSAITAVFAALLMAAPCLAAGSKPAQREPPAQTRQRYTGYGAMVAGALAMAAGVALEYGTRGRAATATGAILARDIETTTFGVGAITLLGGSYLLLTALPPAPAPPASPSRAAVGSITAGLGLRASF